MHQTVTSSNFLNLHDINLLYFFFLLFYYLLGKSSEALGYFYSPQRVVFCFLFFSIYKLDFKFHMASDVAPLDLLLSLLHVGWDYGLTLICKYYPNAQLIFFLSMITLEKW